MSKILKYVQKSKISVLFSLVVFNSYWKYRKKNFCRHEAFHLHTFTSNTDDDVKSSDNISKSPC